MLSRRVAVTGASRGIGRAIALELQARGVEVLSSSKTGVGGSVVDVADDASVAQWLLSLTRADLPLHAVVHCAGICEATTSLANLTPQTWRHILEVNATGTFHVVRHAAAILVAQGHGDIIVVGSRAARKPHPYLHAYSASKAAVRSLVQSVAKQLAEEGSSVRCLSVSPAGVNTDMRRALFGSDDSQRQQPASDVARIVVDILDHQCDVPSGSDVIVTQGQIETIYERP